MLTFLTIQKKDLSDNSKIDGGENPEKLRQECSGSCESDAGDFFGEGINDSNCCDILCNCLKELEAKVVKIYKEANTTKEIQIKGEKQKI